MKDDGAEKSELKQCHSSRFTGTDLFLDESSWIPNANHRYTMAPFVLTVLLKELTARVWFLPSLVGSISDPDHNPGGDNLSRQ